ncbi:hypothetical protein T552_01508 [Pneumocystis carinii B80]|uniref:Myb-like domain-containing protein n=1 Tax=Pneumocystis carinii (strain B80) TaxID=1408658 RepID=A0A0W4ZKI5_PNEC8|nr:hypothetical protein T552_01508 [Pneumocystis carinii B80]KTW28879.1 hypothetical protein T552_01508 [Pneumocystis carinii B80]
MEFITESVVKSRLRFTPRVSKEVKYGEERGVEGEKVVEKGMEDKGIREERVIYKEKEKELMEKKGNNGIKSKEMNGEELEESKDVFSGGKTEDLGNLEDIKRKVKSEGMEEEKIQEKEEKSVICNVNLRVEKEYVGKSAGYNKVLEGKEGEEDNKGMIYEVNDDVEQSVKETRKNKKKRAVSPINSEEITIEPDRIKISDLCKDIRIGRKSVKFNEIRKMEAVKKKMKTNNGELSGKKILVNGKVISERENGSIDKNIQKTNMDTDNMGMSIIRNGNMEVSKNHLKGAPQVRVVNGKIVIDETSLQVDRRERDVNPDAEMELVEENDLSRKVNSASWGKREKSDRWSLEETQRFYNALSQWGTDFGVICKMFPNRSQRQIKNKFNSEEKKYPERINTALKLREPIDIVAYSKAIGSTFRSIDEIQDELKKVKEDFEESRRISMENSRILINKNV